MTNEKIINLNEFRYQRKTSDESMIKSALDNYVKKSELISTKKIISEKLQKELKSAAELEIAILESYKRIFILTEALNSDFNSVDDIEALAEVESE